MWLQIRRTGKLIYEFGGTHDIDQNWIKKVKDAGAKRKVKSMIELKIKKKQSLNFLF